MRSLGELGGGFGEAHAGNSHRRVVGQGVTPGGAARPFLWTPERGMRRLPTLGGNTGNATDINEFGIIAGGTTTAGDLFRATLWAPTPGPLLAESDAEEAASPAAAQRAVDVALCALREKQAGRALFWSTATRACLHR
jgi:hypothetical protein